MVKTVKTRPISFGKCFDVLLFPHFIPPGIKIGIQIGHFTIHFVVLVLHGATVVEVSIL